MCHKAYIPVLTDFLFAVFYDTFQTHDTYDGMTDYQILLTCKEGKRFPKNGK